MSALRVKQEPPASSPGGAGVAMGFRYHVESSHMHQHPVCYVCGAPGTDYRLHTRPRDKGSYFPFLESHEAAEGAPRPGADGVVAACVVCYSFLTQQWEAFERSRTPLAKRLYWLKRSDLSAESYHQHNQGDYGHMKSVPVVPSVSHHRSDGGPRMVSRHEEDTRGGPGSNCQTQGGSLVDEESRDSTSLLDLRSSRETDRRHRPQQHSRSSGSGRSSRGEAPTVAVVPPSNGALDLSMPDKNAATEVCYLCGTEAPKGTLMNIYAKPITNCPFFPSLTLHPRASGSRPMDPSGRVQACGACHQHLLQQWDTFQKLNVHHSERHYRLRKATKVPTSQRQPLQLPSLSPSFASAPSKFLCFLCGVETPSSQQRQLLSAAHPNHPEEPYFPFLEKMRPPKNVPPLPTSGRALVCSNCHRAVLAQHQQLGNRPQPGFGLPNSAELPPGPQNGVPTRERAEEYGSCNCYTCGVLCPAGHAVPIASAPNAGHTMFFPFLREISPPVGVRPVDDAGQALVCRACASSLRHQWEAFECEHVPHTHRRYVLYAQPPAGPETQLRIEVPEDSNPRGPPQPLLLATVNSARPETPTQQPQHHHPRQGASSSSSSTSAALDLSGGRAGIPPTTTVVCYVCGAKTSADDMYSLRSYPKHGDEGAAFFPFLTLHAAPCGADPMTEDGTVLSCIFCYHTLMSQWSSPESTHRNPWTRSYDFHDYVCFVCGVTTYRKRVKAITVVDFPFLVEHPRPSDALVLRGGASVTVCLMCYETLNVQWSDFERMKVPLELRKYNWIAAPPPPEVDDDADRQRAQQQHTPYHHRQAQPQRTYSRSSRPSPSVHSPVNGETSSDRLSVVVTDEEGDQQPRTSLDPHSRGMAPTPSKAPPHQPPPPHGLLPVVPKVCRSSSQISPECNAINHHGHGHSHLQSPYNHQQQQQHSARNASFAAALRKLAIKQATDPVSDHDATGGSPVQGATCPSSQSSKRSSAPTQPPPPLLVTGSMSAPADHSPYKGCERTSRDHNDRDVDDDSGPHEALKYHPYQNQRSREETHAHYQHLRGSSRHEETATGFQPYRSSSSQGPTQVDGHHRQQHAVHHPHVRSHTHPLNHHPNSLGHPTAMTPGGYDHVAHAAATAAAAAAAAAAATYPYQPSFLNAAHLPPHPAFRLVDPMYLDRYGHLLRPPHMLHVAPPQHPSAGLLPPHFAYAQELMASQPVGLVSPADAAALAHERVKIEEQQRRERERMMSPQHHQQQHHHVHHDQHHGERRGSIVHGTPRDASRKSPSSSRPSVDMETNSYSNTGGNHHHRPRAPSPRQIGVRSEEAASQWQQPRVPSHRQTVDETPPEVRHFWDIPTSGGMNRITPGPMTTTEAVAPNPRFTPMSSPLSPSSGDAIIVSADDPCSPAFGRLSKMALSGVPVSHRVAGTFAPPTVSSPPPLLKMKSEPCRSPEKDEVVCLEDERLVSRLDAEERRRRERRSLRKAGEEDGEDSEEDDGSESEDERTWNRLMTICSGPPLPLDESRAKLRFLGHVGLTSHKRRQELELQRLKLRRRRLRERSLSPIPVVSPKTDPPETKISLRSSESKEPARLKEQDFRGKAEFVNRLGLEPLMGNRRQELEVIWAAVTGERKRRNGFVRQGAKRKVQVKTSDLVVGKACKRVGISDSIRASKKISTEVKNGETVRRPNTRLLQPPSLLSSKKTDTSSCADTGLLTEGESNEHSSADSRMSGDESHGYTWPGIEVLMGAYEKYRQEHQLEREVLLDQCGRLKDRHGELRKVAERLSRQMADLIRTKGELDEERQRRQCAIDRLKRCLMATR